MKVYILFLALFIGITVATAQKDSTQTFPDIVSLTSGGVIRGEILSFDPITGSLVFKDYAGRTRFFAKEDYKYFKEDEPYKVKKRKQPLDSTQIHTRKTIGTSYRAGISAVYSSFSYQMDENNSYEATTGSVPYTPINLILQAGYQLEKNIFLGQAEIQLNKQPSSYYQVGLRYERILSEGKRNRDWYLPFELTYSSYQFPLQVSQKDTIYNNSDSTDWSYPRTLTLEQKLTGINLGIGIGRCYYFANQSSLRIELNMMRYLILNKSTQKLEKELPTLNLSTFPIRFMISYEF